MLTKTTKRIITFIAVIAVLLTTVFVGATNIETTKTYASYNDAPKYVFYLIGDGMGASQRQIAQYYLQQTTNDDTKELVMNTLPIAGINTTHSSDTLVTDSAAAATALATGYKTKNGMIAVDPDGNSLETVLEMAQDKGYATGSITTTRLTHATPAAFASHNISRNDENGIATEMSTSGVNFLAGGGYRHFVPSDWKWGKSKRSDERNLLQEMYTNGYKVFVGEKLATQAFRSYEPQDEDKVAAIFGYSHMPYELDREKDNILPSLSEITEKGIDVLSTYDDGFFLMVEGGRIDHACHANDPKGAICDTIEFDNAVKVCLDFYEEHKDETLIVVAADHETGGLGLGFSTNYFLDLNQLGDIKVSVEDILQSAYDGDREAYYTYIANNYGLDDLTATEKAKIESAMDLVDQEKTNASLYAYYNPVAIATTHIASERANVQWTTYAHSGTLIPLSAIGHNSSYFQGYKDNTEIGQAMIEAMGLN